MTETATARLSRLLAMVPWLLSHQGVAVSDAAREFGVSEQQLIKDLELLFVCGLPGHLPDDLIEADWDSGYVYLSNAEAISRPLRLRVDEALALIVGLRTLAQVPGLGDRDAVSRALAKLEDAAGDAAAPAGQVRVDLGTASTDVLHACRDGLRRCRRLRLEYLIPHRDVTTRRDVDPIRVQNMDDRWYVEGWCHQAEAVRTFRLDRVRRIEVLDVDGTVPDQACVRDLDAGVFAPGPNDHHVRLALDPTARWVIDYYPVDDVAHGPAGELLVTFRTGDLMWLRALALRLSGAARVLHPPELAEEVAQAARAALVAYS
ncbi:MAG: helix-turn-helix transcriptional regulator [Angustibacter sp.]